MINIAETGVFPNRLHKKIKKIEISTFYNFILGGLMPPLPPDAILTYYSKNTLIISRGYKKLKVD